jgi:two-component system, NtrC family, sensor kinase
MPSIFSALKSSFQSQLSRQLSLWVLVGIFGIEVVIFFPSAYRRKDEKLDTIAMTATATIHAIEQLKPTELEFAKALPNLKQDAPLLGGILYRNDGSIVQKFGEDLTLNFNQASQKQTKLLYSSPWRYETARSIRLQDQAYYVVLSHDANLVLTDLISFSWRILGLVFLISISVALLMMAIINSQLIYPILRLQSDIVRSGQAIAQFQSKPEFESLQYGYQNELQEVIQAFSHNHETIVSAIAQRQKSEANLQQTLTHLQETQAQLIHTEKMSSLGKLGAGFAHEINNPINFIYANLDHLNQHTQDLLTIVAQYQQEFPTLSPDLEELVNDLELEFIQQDMPDLLKSMKSGAARIRDLVASFRNFIRLDESSLKVVDLHQGLESTLALLDSKLNANADRSSIQVDRQYHAKSEIACYPSQINQVFFHLLSNAIEAIDRAAKFNEKAYLITILTQETAQSFEISIVDNGIGVDPEIESNIFDPFFTTKDVGEGAGLGLTNSHNVIVNLHGGTLKMRSVLKQETLFIFTIPKNLDP